jgi:hypothetical protein
MSDAHGRESFRRQQAGHDHPLPAVAIEDRREAVGTQGDADERIAAAG